ncbi:MAG: hypothetical protein VKO44_11840 [Cyanobacteriota bacterium]|nr:hypothetical protein [Cyanobacteriota bacterium]
MRHVFELEQASIIYVFCPARIVTGGPEAVHQLVHKLRCFGRDARIVPVPDVPNPALLQYRNYRVRFARSIDDHQRNVLITTEVNPRALDRYRLIQKAIWWLSVDFHETLTEPFEFGAPHCERVKHLVQSAYAESFVRQRGVKTIHYLSDYLNQIYMRPAGRQRKNDNILYTPVKGADAVVQRLRQADPTLRWLALRGMTRKKHAQTMRQAKVYVDFGSHPGKDRQPREAVVNGCCVIVGASGSARFEQDMPIQLTYKFNLNHADEQAILATIRRCLSDYAMRIHDFDAYATRVRREERIFEREVEALFGSSQPSRQPLLLTTLANVVRFARQNDAPTVMRALLNEFLPPDVTARIKRLFLRVSARRRPGAR